MPPSPPHRVPARSSKPGSVTEAPFYRCRSCYVFPLGQVCLPGMVSVAFLRWKWLLSRRSRLGDGIKCAPIRSADLSYGPGPKVYSLPIHNERGLTPEYFVRLLEQRLGSFVKLIVGLLG